MKLSYRSVGFSKSDEKYFTHSIDEFMKHGLFLTKVEKGEQVRVHLTSAKRMKELYGKSNLSLTDRGTNPIQIHLLETNWNAIPKKMGSDYTSLDDYRSALVSHEFAHAFGHDHVSCACVGCESDVRQQPTRSLGGCLPTTNVVFNPDSPHSDVNF